VSLLGVALGGISAASDRFDRAAQRIARAGTPGAKEDLTTDLIEERIDSTQVASDVKVAQTADQMAGTILDIVA
jgi:hypothetical protein